jgi:hypothetical protein
MPCLQSKKEGIPPETATVNMQCMLHALHLPLTRIAACLAGDGQKASSPQQRYSKTEAAVQADKAIGDASSP